MLLKGILDMKYGTVLFDFDGTLVDSAKIILPCIDYTYGKMGLLVPERGVLNKFIGPPLHDSFRAIGMREDCLDRAVEIYREYFNSNNFFGMDLFGGMEQLLADLKSAGACLAVASVRVETKLKEICNQMNLNRFLDAICGRVDELNVLTKADVIRRTLKELGKPADNAVLVGDSKFDEEGAAEAGVDFIAVLYGFGFESAADIEKSVFIADSVAELTDYLMNK